MAVIRRVPENRHWRLEYPVGKVLLDTINWISNPKISPDGKSIAFADHENSVGDDQGSLAVIGPDGKEKKIASGYVSLQGVAWSPSGDEVWFTSTKSGSAQNLRGATLSGRVRDITNVPGGMWLQDVRNGLALTITHQQRIGIRGLPPGAKDEVELGWFGWSIPKDFSRDGKQVLFEEEGEGGGPNYSVFLRNTDGAPPVKIGEGRSEAISSDRKWVVTQSTQDTGLRIVPTGAGVARQLTKGDIRFVSVSYMPDGKQLLAVGIEPGHGARTYLIDVNSGDAKPLTPEGVTGTLVSPDGRNVLVVGPDGQRGVWPVGGTEMRVIPGLDSKVYMTGWAPDGNYAYAGSSADSPRISKLYRVDIATGKMESWKTFGENIASGVTGVSPPTFSSDGTAYEYLYVQLLSEAYVVKGLR